MSDNVFLGFYCLIKKFLPKEKNPEAYAVAGMAGSTSFFYFAITYFFLRRGATILETVGIFLVLYAAHHFLFVKDDKHLEMEKEITCSDQLIYRSVLFFVTSFSVLMYVSSVLN